MNASDDPCAAPASCEPADPPAAAPAAPTVRQVGAEPDPWASPSTPPAPESSGREPGQASGGSTCYLLHFDRPYMPYPGAPPGSCAGHYSGTATDLPARLAEHEKGQGARLLQVVKAAGITWRLARTWPGGRDRERQLKNQGGASRRCPECGVTPRSAQGARQQTAARKQPQAREDAQAQSPRPSSEHAGPGGVHAQLTVGIQRSAALPEAIPAKERQPRELDSPQLTDMEAEL